MRSGTSFFNSALWRKTMGRFWPLWALYAAGWAFALPLNLLNQFVSGRSRGYGAGDVRDWMMEAAQSIPDWLQFGVWVSCIFGLLCAMAVFGYPTAQQLAEIAIASAHTAKVFGIEPRVAMLSYSTGTSGKGADVDVVVEATKIAQEMAPDLALEGPLQYDAAIDPTVAKTKMPDSKVAGKATVFIFPDLNTGNNTYKAVQRAAGAVAIGPVLQGLNKPVNDLSRGCTVPDIVNTVAITAVQAAAEKAAAKQQ